MTGAMIPKGADSVVMQEFTERENGTIKVYKKFFHICMFQEKERILEKGI